MPVAAIVVEEISIAAKGKMSRENGGHRGCSTKIGIIERVLSVFESLPIPIAEQIFPLRGWYCNSLWDAIAIW